MLQIKGDIEDELGKIFTFILNKKTCFDPSLEPSSQDGSNEEPEHFFNHPQYPLLYGAL